MGTVPFYSKVIVSGFNGTVQMLDSINQGDTATTKPTTTEQATKTIEPVDIHPFDEPSF
jgi:hypothetical protein